MILVTGAAGFIGFHACNLLLQQGETVLGVDSFVPYYDVSLKKARLAQLQKKDAFLFVELDLADREKTAQLFAEHDIEYVIHLAAQPGVRYSIKHPMQYIDANLNGFITILEGCRQHKIKHLLFASTSSVYGANTSQPYKETDHTDHPLSLYAATKKANEVMAHSYASLYNLPCTGLRFFTVYGPWGRPDMAIFSFTKAIMNGDTIQVFNRGEMLRDFTFVGDIAQALAHIVKKPAKSDKNHNSNQPDPSRSHAPYRIYNIGNNQPVKLMDFISTIEQAVGKKAIIDLQPLQAGDMVSTFADTSALQADFAYKPTTALKDGIQAFVDWYQKYYKV